MRVVGPAAWGEIEPTTAYALLRLRVDVFVVEQSCPYPELDGRDLEPATEHRWIEPAGTAGPGGTDDADGTDGADGRADPSGEGAVLAYLRVLAEPGGGRRVGRVVTAPSARGAGLSARLMTGVVADHGAGPLVLDAQAHLQGWYARFGFSVDGPGFVEDGIPHVPMRRAPTP